ncbi:Choline dehydrogenase [Rhizobium miluonense]|uniref:Choline dehydrogenase n=2 Tax=Rhizobium miluonense TaxID=411945 RepID=A0A1C3U6J9_9HYPH|nr:Choline dehydrogenase [Rhizobium miluonense]
MSDAEHHSAPLAPTIAAEEAAAKSYDAVIVGAGISGAILAHELTSKGYRVLILEAGLGRDLSQDGYQRYLETFYSNPNKDNNAPFPRNPNAEMPRGPDLRKLAPGETNTEAYWVQSGPYVSDSVYTRVLGGTTVHWEAKAIRMLREDFRLKSNFGQGLDWPIGLDDLMPFYDKAEFVLGVSGDAAAQRKVGVEYSSDDYVYPMVELQASYLDQIVSNGLKGMQAQIDGEKIDIDWITFPQAKNADPNPDYAKWNDGRPYQPVGAISMHQNQEGERCQGNTNCVPLCPVQARFDARKVLIKAIKTGRAELVNQAVASRVFIHPETGAVTEIEVKRYEDRKSPNYKSYRVRGKIFILAANAVENARLMLASAVQNGQAVNDLMGRHLMDHPYLLCWGLLPVDAGVGRGPSCTSGLCNFRGGNFRRKFASFAADIHNDGWGWATGSPGADLTEFVDARNLHGRALRKELTERLSRQLLLAYMIEMPADPESRVTVDEQYIDRLGNMRPVVSFKLSDYSMATAEFARGLSKEIFQKLGARDYTQYNSSDYGYVTYNGNGYAIRGGNHLSGTHVMGTSSSNSVVDVDQKSWDHRNLYIIGPGSMPSIGSSNTTLTTAALCLKTSEAALKHLTYL